MKLITTLLFALAFVLAVLSGGTTVAWTWGAAMVALSLALLSNFFFEKRHDSLSHGNTVTWILGLFTLLWFVFRAVSSPVWEFAQTDLMLILGTAGSFILSRSVVSSWTHERLLIWSLAALMLVHNSILFYQYFHPAFSPIYAVRPYDFPSGLFCHYNHAANFMSVTALFFLSFAWFGKTGKATRISWSLIALFTIVGVFLTKSRGGLLELVIGLTAFGALVLCQLKQAKSKWFAPLIIIIPIAIMVLGLILVGGWEYLESARGLKTFKDKNVTLVDSPHRISMLSLGLSTALLHLFMGGGSQSYRWECLQAWERGAQGSLTAKPEFVHNEWVQCLTDYGLIGAILATAFISWLVFETLIKWMIREKKSEQLVHEPALIGGISALIAIAVQSSFSFVLHDFPNAILFGLSLGFVAHSVPEMRGGISSVRRLPLIGTSLLVSITLAYFGYLGIRLTTTLWQSHIVNRVSDYENVYSALSNAIQIQKLPSFYSHRARISQAALKESNVVDQKLLAETALSDYSSALYLYPNHYESLLNSANIKSYIGRDAEATEDFKKLIKSMGEIERPFRSHHFFAEHQFRTGVKLLRTGDEQKAIAHLELAKQEINTAELITWGRNNPYYHDPEARALEYQIHENLGFAYETERNFKSALESYTFLSTLPGGQIANFRVAQACFLYANQFWYQRRPAQALFLFLKSQEALAKCTERPQGVTLSQRDELAYRIARCIKYLKDAKVNPLPVDQ